MRRTAAVVLVLALGGLFGAPPSPAAAADETTGFLVDPQHSGAVPDSPLVPPLRPRWQANLGTPVSTVLATGGRITYVREPLELAPTLLG